MLLCTP
jgi:hypothetical protein